MGLITLGRGTQDQCDATRIRPLQGRTLLGCVFRGRCPRLLNLSPAGIKNGTCRGHSGAQKTGTTPSGALGLNYSPETSNSSSSWNGGRAVASHFAVGTRPASCPGQGSSFAAALQGTCGAGSGDFFHRATEIITGVIWDVTPFETLVIPAKAGIHSRVGAFPMACGLDSRLRGNDCTCERSYLANDTSIQKLVVLE